MSDGVKFIFKSLFKVPIIILASYLVFNLFAFALTYFKMLGFSQLLVQTVTENNYIPPRELESLQQYLDKISNTGVVSGAEIVLQGDDASILPADVRRQYGSPVVVGVRARYKFIFPLMPTEQLNDPDTGFEGMEGGSFSGYADDSTLDNRRQEKIDSSNSNIEIVYTVPGLQYYPDLS